MLLQDQISWALRELRSLGWQTLAAVIVALALYVAWRWWRRRVARAPDVAGFPRMNCRRSLLRASRPLAVDVRRGRTTQQIDPRRIPDAIAIDLDMIEARRDELPRDRKIVVYCGCPNEASAAKAARLLLKRGYPWVRPLTGGLEAWSRAAEGQSDSTSTTALPSGGASATAEWSSRVIADNNE